MVIMVLALVFLGPDKLPEAAKQAGKYLSEFRRMSNGFQQELRDAMDLDPKGTAPAPDHPTPGLPPLPVDDSGSNLSPEADHVAPAMRPPTAATPEPDSAVSPAPPSVPDTIAVEGPSGSFL